MGLPANITTITVTGTFLDTAGNPSAGTVWFTPSSALFDVYGTCILTAEPVIATLTSGSFSVVLPCTNNVGLQPNTFYWSCTIAVQYAAQQAVTFYLPSTLGSTVDLSALIPVPAQASAVNGIYVSTVNGQSGSITIAAAPPGNGTAGQVPASTGTGTSTWSYQNAAAVNVLNYGASNTGSADATAAITAAIAAAGGAPVYLPAGTYLLNTGTALTVSTAGTVLFGDGPNATLIKYGSAFAASTALTVAAASCTVRDIGITGTSSTVASNPACTGIAVTGQAHCRFDNLWFQYVNGWCLQSTGGSTASNVDTMISRIVGRNCAAGILAQGVSGSSFQGEHFLTSIQFQQMGTTTGPAAGLPAVQVQDCSDVIIQGVNAGMAAGVTASAMIIEGASATVPVTNIDVGANQLAGGSPALLITSTSNGSPSGVSIYGGSVEGGLYACEVNAGTDITLAFRMHQAYSTGLYVAGASAEVLAAGCSFAANNQSGGTGYDIDCSTMTGGNFRASACRLETSIGTGTTGEVPQSVNTSPHGYYKGCYFIATGTAPSNVFTGTPQQVTDCVGYNPRGSVSAPSVGASPYTPGSYQAPLMIVFTAINGMTQFAIGGVALTVLPAAGVPYPIGVRESMTVTWATTAPTWQWYAL